MFSPLVFGRLNIARIDFVINKIHLTLTGYLANKGDIKGQRLFKQVASMAID